MRFVFWPVVLGKRGGRLVIIDGDFVRRSPAARLLDWLAHGLGVLPRRSPDPVMTARHRAILDRVHFRHGARADDVSTLLRAAGFDDIRIDRGLGPVNRAIARHAGILEGLRRETQHRYVITASLSHHGRS